MKSQTDDKCEEEDNQTFRGDAIGSTIYSQRFVLKTLLSLQEYIKESYQNELNKEEEDSLCNLWDMSADNEVALYLINECNAVYLFTNLLLSLSSNGIEEINIQKRLEEISLGILANIIPLLKADQRNEFATRFPDLPVRLLNYNDGPFLIQAIRFWRCLLYDIENFSQNQTDFEKHPWKYLLENIKEWFPKFVFVLQSSTDRMLLTSTIEFIHWLIQLEIPVSKEKKKLFFEDIIATKELVASLVECINELKNQSSSQRINELQGCLKNILEILHYCFNKFNWAETEQNSEQKESLNNCMIFVLDCFFEDNKEQKKDLIKYEMPEPFLTNMLNLIQNIAETDST